MISLKRLTAKAWMLALVSAVLATLVAEGLYRSGWARGAEYLYSDLWHRMAGKRHEPEHVALVMIDEATLLAHQDEPLVFWTPHFARAIETLRAVGARVVALDFLFSGSPERWLEKLRLATQDVSRGYDRPFRNEINRGDVVLAGFRVGKGSSVDDFILPSPDYLLALPELDLAGHVGLANLRSDPDGAIRRFGVMEADAATARPQGLPSLALGALAATHHSGQKADADTWRFGGRDWATDSEAMIGYAGPPGTIRPISFERLLRADAASDPALKALAGKAVIVGAGYAGMNDVHSTPYSTTLAGAQALMAGPEIQANIVETLLGGRYLDAVATPWRMLAFVAGFGMLAILGVRLPPWSALLLLAAIAVGGAAAGYALFARQLLFPVAHFQLGLLVVMSGLVLLRLTREERERARIGAMFGRYVSGQVVTALMASPELPELGGQAKRVTVLFSDIRNFTTISERLSAKEVVEMLNTYFERACAALLKEGAIIDKFIGDAIMAEFGAPLPQQDHALRAIRAAVALRAVAADFQQWMGARFADRHLPEFDVGIGIHTGEAVIGNIGSSTRMEYTAIGDTVNLASRLEGKTKETDCAILASADTVAAAGNSVQTGARHILTVKGRSQPVEAVEVVSVA